MKLLSLLLLFLSTTLLAKPIIDIKDANMGLAQGATYERPNFTFKTLGKNSHIIVVTDQHLDKIDDVRTLGYEKIIAYLMEPRAIHGHIYPFIEKNLDKFDLVLTYDKELLDRYPEKCKFVHAVGWGTLYDHQVHEKSKMCSIMTGKNWTEGHKLRLDALDKYKPYFDHYKTYETPWVRWKDEWTNDFHFAVIIENSKCPHYFTEKILECFRAGTIPIYWGCPTIGQFFDIDGIIVFNSLEDLGPILQSLSVEEYNKRLPAVHRNFEIAGKFPTNNLVTRPDFDDSLDVLWPYVEQYFLNR